MGVIEGSSESLKDEIALEAVFAAVIEMSDDAIFTCDIRGNVATWGTTAERLFGLPGQEVLGGPLDVFAPAHLRNELRVVVATVLAGDRIKHFETEIQRPDGMPLPVSLSMCPVLDPEMAPVGAVVIARDVTEQRLAQATLAELDARMEAGEALAHMGSWMWDLRTGAVQWSLEFHRIHGVDPLDFGGTLEAYLDLIHPADREAIRVAMLDSVESGRPFEGSYRVVQSDDLVRTVQLRAQPTLGSAGTVVGLRGIGHDITGQSASGLSQKQPDS